MKPYADQPARRFRQILGDLLLVTWVILWVRVGRAVHDVVGELAAPGRALESAGTSLGSGMTTVSERISDVPVVGDDLTGPFETAGDGASSIADAGVDIQDGVARTAIIVAVAVAGWPIVVAVLLWLWRRLRFARTAGAAAALSSSATGLDLFALRALAQQPLAALARIGDDPAGDWRRGDRETIRALARLELDAVGVALPAHD
jgi:hypothetical protein